MKKITSSIVRTFHVIRHTLHELHTLFWLIEGAYWLYHHTGILF